MKQILRSLLPWLCCLFIIPVHAAASESENTPLNEEKIHHSYNIGLSKQSGEMDRGELTLKTFGRSVHMVGTNEDGLVRESLTCLLCTSDELYSAARSLGATVQAQAKDEKPGLSGH